MHRIPTGTTPQMALVDRGCRGVQAGAGTWLLVRPTRLLCKKLKNLLKRRPMIGPMIVHMKADGLLQRIWLKAALGGAMRAVLCGAGHNLRMILAHLGVPFEHSTKSRRSV